MELKGKTEELKIPGGKDTFRVDIGCDVPASSPVEPEYEKLEKNEAIIPPPPAPDGDISNENENPDFDILLQELDENLLGEDFMKNLMETVITDEDNEDDRIEGGEYAGEYYGEYYYGGEYDGEYEGEYDNYDEGDYDGQITGRKRGRSSRRDPNRRKKKRAKTVRYNDLDWNDMDSWSDARRQAYYKKETDPNLFYYRFLNEGEKQTVGKWSEEEREQFLKKVEDENVPDQDSKLWGLFSMDFKGRMGYQCANYYRKLILEGYIEDEHFGIKLNRKEERVVYLKRRNIHGKKKRRRKKR